MREDSGIAAVMVAVMVMPVLIVSCAMGIDVSSWYMTAARIQRAADSAALAGVIHLPGDVATASATAIKYAGENGFPVKAGTTTVTAVQVPTKRSQLKVTITSKVNNSFGAMVGIPTETIAREAVADFAGPIPMGSPCNIFGNEPPAGGSSPYTARSSACTFGATPGFWASIAGPGAVKENGDQFASKVCGSGVYGCSGSVNNDYSKPAAGYLGYFYKVPVAAGSGSINFETYDPAFVATGEKCSALLPKKASDIPSNTLNPEVTDAKTRYLAGNVIGEPQTQFCTGDAEYGSAADAANAVTTFTVRAPSELPDPSMAPVIAGCTKQFRGYGTDVIKKLTMGDPAYTSDGGVLAKSFRQWVTLCNVGSPVVGDYYMQVRTNIAWGAGGLDAAMSAPDSGSLNWNGQNYYSLRVKAGIDGTKVSVTGADRMSIFGNLSGSQRFYLARIGSVSAGQQLKIYLFDAGDADKNGSVTIFAPGDGAKSSLDCYEEISPGNTDDLTNCTRTVSRGDNGELLTVVAQVPKDYSCTDATATSCWFRIAFDYPSSSVVNDTTTWSVDLSGNRVRLVS